MRREIIEQKVRAIAVNELGLLGPEEASMDASWVDDLGADSLDGVMIVMALEEEFDIDIPDEDAEELTTVGAVVDYLEGRLV